MPKSAVNDDNCERFIELVRRNAILYDPKCPGHKDAQRMYNLWESIAKVMAKYHKMPAMDWKKKWRNLRDTYVKKQREIRTTVSWQVAQKAQKWKYLGILNFLDAYVEENSTDTNVPSQPPQERDEWKSEENDEGLVKDEDEDDTANTWASSMFVSQSQSQSQPVTSHLTDQINSVWSPRGTTPSPAITEQWKQTRHKRRKDEASEMEQALTEMIKNTTKTRQDIQKRLTEEKTPDDAFYESCALRSKVLPAATRSFLQLQVAQLFVNAENPQLTPVPITPLPEHQHYQQHQQRGSYGSVAEPVETHANPQV